MSFTDACIYFIIGILTIAHPLLLQVIGRLDERYESNLITRLFKQEKSNRGFQRILPWSLIATALHCASQLSYLDSWAGTVYLLSFTEGLLIVAGITLILGFFNQIRTIRIYYEPELLVKHFIKQTENNEHTYFKALADILLLAIKKQDDSQLTTLNQYFHKKFADYRRQSEGKPVQYPVVYYEMVYKTVRETAPQKLEKMALVADRASSGLWLLGSFEEYEIHEDTYIWLWRIAVVLVENKRDDLLIRYWENANQYFSVSLKPVPSEVNWEGVRPVTVNADAVNKREAERQRFYEFHLALGGLILYRGRYDCIRRIFNYTSSFPPRYYLLPESTNQVLTDYFWFLDPHSENFTFIQQRYWLPGTEGMDVENEVKYWICQYITLLFLRLYTLQSYYYGMEPLAQPRIPESKADKAFRITYLDVFLRDIKLLLSNYELLKALKLDVITPQWAVEQQKLYPTTFIDTYKERIKAEMNEQEEIQKPDAEHVNQFKQKSIEILKGSMTAYSVIANPTLSNENYEDHIVQGTEILADKSPFVRDQGSHHLNFDSYFAQMLADNIKRIASLSIHSRIQSRYLLKGEDFIKALDKLQLKKEEYVIVNFGVDLEWVAEKYNISQLTAHSFKDIPIITVDSEAYDFSVLGNCLLVCKQSELPHIDHLPLEERLIRKYHLEPYDDDTKLYGQVIDLNADEDLKQELQTLNPSKVISKHVLLCLEFQMRLRWKKGQFIVQLRPYDEFMQQGYINDLSDVQPLELPPLPTEGDQLSK